jgi:predicted RNase H-like nuclease
MSVKVVGACAFAHGWVGVVLRDGKFDRAMLAPSLYDLITRSSGITVFGVGCPLGMLPDRWRAADILAADYVGPRRGHLFRVAPLLVWQEADFAAAVKLCREITGHRLSRQSWGMRPKIQEANALWARHPGLLLEAHPEVSFRAMAGQPLQAAKQTWIGQAIRRELLADNGIVLPKQLGPAGQAPPDDLLDAAAVAWTTHRKATAAASSHPDPPEQHNGSAIAIWY